MELTEEKIMKNYTITVNGTAYSVTVEEAGASAAPVAPAAPAPVPAAPVAAPAAPAAPAPQASGAQGGIEVTASVPGKVFNIPAKVGDSLKPGDTVIVLESMKMEIPVVAPEAGTVASINVTVGSQVETGDLLATLN